MSSILLKKWFFPELNSIHLNCTKTSDELNDKWKILPLRSGCGLMDNHKIVSIFTVFWTNVCIVNPLRSSIHNSLPTTMKCPFTVYVCIQFRFIVNSTFPIKFIQTCLIFLRSVMFQRAMKFFVDKWDPIYRKRFLVAGSEIWDYERALSSDKYDDWFDLKI